MKKLFIILICLILLSCNEDKIIYTNHYINKDSLLYEVVIKKIKKFEGYRSRYIAPDGHVTIGYGIMINKSNKYLLDLKMDTILADKILREKFDKYLEISKNKYNLRSNKSLAIACLLFNLGDGTFSKSKLAKLLINKNHNNIQRKHFLSFCKYRNKDSVIIESSHLKKRRKWESGLFFMKYE